MRGIEDGGIDENGTTASGYASTRRVPRKAPSFAASAPAACIPVPQQKRRPWGQLDVDLLPIVRAGETHYGIGEDGERCAVRDACDKTLRAAVRRSVDLGGGLRKNQRRGVLPRIDTNLEPIAVDEPSAQSDEKYPRCVPMILGCEESERTLGERRCQHGLRAGAPKLEVCAARRCNKKRSPRYAATPGFGGPACVSAHVC